MDSEWECDIVDFEVKEITDDSNPYLALLGIDWPFDMKKVINLKKNIMTFEKKELRVIVPFDPTEGTEPVRDYKEYDGIDKIYKMTTWDEDWINPIVDG